MNYNTDINYNEEPVIIKQNNGDSYLRTGYCCQCGQCCMGNNQPESICPMFSWLEVNVRGICTDQDHQLCGQDKKMWPECQENIQYYPKCTYKFEIINQL